MLYPETHSCTGSEFVHEQTQLLTYSYIVQHFDLNKTSKLSPIENLSISSTILACAGVGSYDRVPEGVAPGGVVSVSVIHGGVAPSEGLTV